MIKTLQILTVEPAAVFGIAIAIIGFFSIRFYFMVDEIRKDVKNLLISEARNSTRLEKLEETVK